MVNNTRRTKCASQACTKRPSYAIEGSNEREFCAQHAHQGMVDISTKKCNDKGCMKWPSYGIEGRKKRNFCAQHAKQGMVVVGRKKCADQSCTKQRSYGIEGSKKPEFCAQHAKRGMVDIRNKRCANQGCTKRPSYGIGGSSKREFCSQHAKQDMVCIRKETRQGCTKRSPLGMEGSETRDSCLPYPEASMVRLDTGRSFGVNREGEEVRRGNPPAIGLSSRIGLAACNQAVSVETSISGTPSPVILSRGTSRKRARRNDNRMAPDSAQVGAKRIRSFGQSQSAGLGLTAALDVVIPDLARDDFQVKLTAAVSDADAATSGGCTELLFSPESGVKVKVE